MDRQTYLDNLAHKNGPHYAHAVMAASMCLSVMGMVATCSISIESQREDLANAVGEFFAIALATLTTSHGWSAEELKNDAEQLDLIMQAELSSAKH